MKLLELQKFCHPLQKVKVLYRDPKKSLQTVEVYDGEFKWLKDDVMLHRGVAVFKSFCDVLYIEIF